MATYSTDRRGLLKILGAIGATCAYPAPGNELFGQNTPEHAEHRGAPPVPASARFFHDRDFQMVSQIAQLIIPKTSTAGAIEAGVPDYLDQVVSRNRDHQLLIADGLRWLDEQGKERFSKVFLELNSEQQLAILVPLCEAFDENHTAARSVRFFGVMKSLTADGYYTSSAGLLEELQYKGNAMLASFPGCTHEH